MISALRETSRENFHFNKTVSVIILSYNNLEYIYDCIDSVLFQDYPCVEIIISDDGTIMFRKEMVEQYISTNARNNIVNCIVSSNSSNLGTVKNINRAISLSNGDFIKLIAADDKLYKTNAISEYVHAFESNKQREIVLSNAVIDYKDGKRGIFKNNRFDSILRTPMEYFSQLCLGNIFTAGAVCFRKSFFEKYGLFDERFFLLEDWPMFLNVTRKGCLFAFIDNPLFEYRIGIGISSETQKNSKFDKDIELCYEISILPYLNQLDQKTRMAVLSKYYDKYVFQKGKRERVLFLLKNPRFLVHKIKRSFCLG